ncbi:MAG: ABC transporter permease [Vallitaleaceae bacterium]|jgi:ribose transport system permease protein|nr:ABC transporter permease [Vallitaleaceae bacterium]
MINRDFKYKLDKMLNKNSQKLIIFLVMIIIYVFFSIFGGNFSTSSTLISIFNRSYFVGFLAIGVTFVIITGGIDLSIGAVMGSSALIAGFFFEKVGVPLWLALIIMIISGLLYGTFNGFLVAHLKLPPFIATLGTMLISLALGSIACNVNTISFPTRFDELGRGWYKQIFLTTSPQFPTGIIVLIVSSVIMGVVLQKTKVGRYTYAIGSNEEATKLSGVDTRKWKMYPYMISGAFAGIAAIAYTASYSSILPGTGQGMELDAIAASVIGGTSLSGGIGSISGTFIGVFIMSILATGLSSMGLPPHYQDLFTGIVVISAVLFDIYRQKQNSKVHMKNPVKKYKAEMDEKISALSAQINIAMVDKEQDLVKRLNEERDALIIEKVDNLPLVKAEYRASKSK